MNPWDRLSAARLTGQHSKPSEPFAVEDKRNNPTKYYKLQSLDPYRKVYQLLFEGSELIQNWFGKVLMFVSIYNLLKFSPHQGIIFLPHKLLPFEQLLSLREITFIDIDFILAGKIKVLSL